MAFKLGVRAMETSTTEGTGPYTLAGAVDGFQTLTAGVGESNSTFYVAFQKDGGWEHGLGVVSGGTLTRAMVIASSNSGNAVNWATGTRQIFCCEASLNAFPYRHNFEGAGTPGATDDVSDGYGPGSWWSSGGDIYICLSNTEGEAAWGYLTALLSISTSSLITATDYVAQHFFENDDGTEDASPLVISAEIPRDGNGDFLKSFVFTATIMAVDYTSGDSAAWRVTALARETTPAETYAIVGSPTVDLLGADSGASGWTCTLGAGDASIEFTCTGEASTEISWTVNFVVDSSLINTDFFS